MNVVANNTNRPSTVVGAEPGNDYSLVFDVTSDYMLLVAVEPTSVFRVTLINAAYVARLQALDPSVTREDLQGLTIREFAEAVSIPPDTYAELAANYDRVAIEHVPVTSEERVEVKGTTFYLRSTYTPVLDAAGACSHVLYVGRDVTSQKMVEHELRGLVTEREVLIKELFHRTQNNMNVISSLFSIYAADATQEEMHLAVADVGEKVQAMSAVHGRLYRSSELYHLMLSEVIDDVVAIVRNEEWSIGRSIEVAVDPLVQISLEVAVPLATVLQQILSTTMRRTVVGPIAVTGSMGPEDIHISVRSDSTQVEGRLDLRDRTGLRIIREIVNSQLKGELVGPDDFGKAVAAEKRSSMLWTLRLPIRSE